MNTTYFTETNLNPTGEKLFSAVHTAVNAVTIATEASWQEVVKKLIEQTHIRSNIPSYSICITDMIRACGFRKSDLSLTVTQLLEKCNESEEKRKYIIKLRYAGYFALVPDNRGSYVIKGIIYGNRDVLHRGLEDIWVYCPGTDNRTGISGTSFKRSLPAETKEFTAKNVNPQEKNVGDCVIRALSAAYNDCSWDEAMDHLAAASGYCEPMVNRTANINLTLSKLGFEHHKKIYRNNKLLTGTEFCELMSHTYFNGERIFVYVGSSHCAAALPVKQDDGTYIYKIQDTWDSTSRKIGDYWTYKEEEKLPQPKPVFNGLQLNEKIKHPRFGEGTIVKITASDNDNILDVDFNKYGIKKISQAWLQKTYPEKKGM